MMSADSPRSVHLLIQEAVLTLLRLRRRPTVCIGQPRTQKNAVGCLTEKPARDIFLEISRKITNMVGKMIKAIIEEMIRCP